MKLLWMLFRDSSIRNAGCPGPFDSTGGHATTYTCLREEYPAQSTGTTEVLFRLHCVFCQLSSYHGREIVMHLFDRIATKRKLQKEFRTP